MIFMQRAANFVDMPEHRLHIVLESELRLHVIEGTVERTFPAWTIISNDINNHCIIAKSHLFNGIYQPANLRIDVFKVTCENFLQS